MVAEMILMALSSLWHFILSSASLATLIGCAAVAVAVLEPKFLDAITDLRKWAIVVAVLAFSYTSIAGKFYNDGLSVKQQQWDDALARETGNGEKAHDDAERVVGPVSPDRSVLRGDPFNRNRGDAASRK
jgi:hypothetical protein